MKQAVDVLCVTEKMTVDRACIHQRLYVSTAGQFAMDLLKMAMHAGVFDGETSTGEAKVRLLTPIEAVDRSVTMAHLVFDRMDKLGWLTEGPSLESMIHDESSPLGFTNK